MSQTLQYDSATASPKHGYGGGSALALDGASSQSTKNQYDAAGNLTLVTDLPIAAAAHVTTG